MARDRQRAKQRRRRQSGASRPPGRPPTRRSGADDVRPDDVGSGSADDAGIGRPDDDPGVGRHGGTAVPGPLDHSSAEVDEARLAEAGLTPIDADEVDTHGDDSDLDETYAPAPDVVEGDVVLARDKGLEVDPSVAEEAEEAAHPARARKSRGRVITFLGHCVDELRRVQWPNRRQVGQATAVVLGFVVLAGGYLGLLDAILKPVVDAIL